MKYPIALPLFAISVVVFEPKKKSDYLESEVHPAEDGTDLDSTVYYQTAADSELLGLQILAAREVLAVAAEVGVL